jgi:hypothetical protein
VILQAFKTKDQLLTHNCDQSTEPKKHVTSQLPKKASGSFKPRRPTPKRQVSSKTTTAVLSTSDKDNNKAKIDEYHKKVQYYKIYKTIASNKKSYRNKAFYFLLLISLHF